MASVKAFIRVSAKKKSEKDVAVRFRVSDERDDRALRHQGTGGRNETSSVYDSADRSLSEG